MSEIDKKIYKRVWDFLGSRDLSVFIFVMGMTYFLILIIFSMVVQLPWVNRISTLLPYTVLYICFFINLIVCEIKGIPVVGRKCRKPRVPETAEDAERFGHKITVQSSELGVGAYGNTPLQRLEKYLRRKGYRVQRSGPKGRSQGSEKYNSQLPTLNSQLLLYAHKGRFSPIGNLIFHISFLFFLAGIGLSVFYRFEGTLILAEGQGIKNDALYISTEETDYVTPPNISFEVEKITPRFWKGMLLFEDLKADVSYNGKKGEVRLSKPLRMDGARVTITGMGITPMYVLKDAQGKELDRRYVNMRIFTPGSEDQFQIPGSPYRVRLFFYPDFELKGEKANTRSMNPVNPTYEARVYRSRDRVFKGFVRPGEEISFDGLSLSLPEFNYCGTFKVVYDKGFGFIWTGFVLMIIGLIWRLLVYKKEISVWQDDSGIIYIRGYSEYYRNLFGVKLEHLAGHVDICR